MKFLYWLCSLFFTSQSPKDLIFTYFSAKEGQVEETHDHVNAIMVPYWVDREKMIYDGVSHGLWIILGPFKDLHDYESTLENLHSKGLLQNIYAIYPSDEPDTSPGIHPKEARSIMGRYPELAQAKLAVIYSASGRYPNIEDYDLVGVDAYDEKEGILKGRLQELRWKLNKKQKMILVPGGADPWRQDPTPFLNYAKKDNKVGMILPFVWFDEESPNPQYGLGIKNNGMAPLYRAAGKEIK